MKKIGVFFGLERQFPLDLIDKINAESKKYRAEVAQIGGTCLECTFDYDLALDRVSVEAPYYLPALKLASLSGKKIINNPFRVSAVDNLSDYGIANQLGYRSPKSVLIPTKHLPHGAVGETFRNLTYPLNWDAIFDHVGFPSYIKPLDIPGWLKVYKVYNQHEFFAAYDLTGSSSVFLQECIEYDYLARTFIIGDAVKTLPYYPFRPLHARFQLDDHFIATAKEIAEFEKIARKICAAIGFESNTVDYGVKDGKIYVLDFLNPAPTYELCAMGESAYNWALDETTKLIYSTLDGTYEPKSAEDIIYNSGAKVKKKKAQSKASKVKSE